MYVEDKKYSFTKNIQYLYRIKAVHLLLNQLYTIIHSKVVESETAFVKNDVVVVSSVNIVLFHISFVC